MNFIYQWTCSNLKKSRTDQYLARALFTFNAVLFLLGIFAENVLLSTLCQGCLRMCCSGDLGCLFVYRQTVPMMFFFLRCWLNVRTSIMLQVNLGLISLKVKCSFYILVVRVWFVSTSLLLEKESIFKWSHFLWVTHNFNHDKAVSVVSDAAVQKLIYCSNSKISFSLPI